MTVIMLVTQKATIVNNNNGWTENDVWLKYAWHKMTMVLVK